MQDRMSLLKSYVASATDALDRDDMFLYMEYRQEIKRVLKEIMHDMRSPKTTHSFTVSVKGL
ncbi:MAG: hypothetical protein INQ03_03885 [Candidatus Heimdallarchaeota archaeon]|nr:hypothetical protein [Candidatus Heimdallarchaeota archaeon]